jgi:3-deoxy-D-manno-octulosonate 8-phosphate phosphatase (KDO 8-P phosphatase)
VFPHLFGNNLKETMPFDPFESWIRQQLVDLQAIAFDVDGVLTDGTLTWSSAGEESKRFSFADIMGVSLLRRLDIKMALISGEPSPLVDRYAEKMHISFVAKGVRDKAAALRDFGFTCGVSLQHTCFFGDDVNDLSAMEIAGLCACPSNAAAEVIKSVTGRGFVASAPGGHGAVRRLADAILAARNLSGREVFQLRPPE